MKNWFIFIKDSHISIYWHDETYYWFVSSSHEYITSTDFKPWHRVGVFQVSSDILLDVTGVENIKILTVLLVHHCHSITQGGNLPVHAKYDTKTLPKIFLNLCYSHLCWFFSLCPHIGIRKNFTTAPPALFKKLPTFLAT